MSASDAPKVKRDAALVRTTTALHDAGFVCIATHPSYHPDAATQIWFKVYARGGRLLIVQELYNMRAGELEGFDVYAPITASPRVDDTIAAIQALAK